MASSAGAKGPERVPQIGRVVIQDDVEIGANTTVDRGAMSDTVIGEGTKIDNLVQIAHNVRIGRDCIVAGHCRYFRFGGRWATTSPGRGVGIADHLTIGSGAKLAAKVGFMSNIPAGERWGGYPAQPMAEAFREIAMLAQAGQDAQAGRGRMADRWRRRRWKRSTYCGLMKLLPHRYPFLMIDRIIDIDGDDSPSASRT